MDSASMCEASPDVAGPSYPAHSAFCGNFYVSQNVDSETLHQTYVPKWNVTNDSALNDPDVCRVARQTCLSSKVRLRLEHKLRGGKKFEGKCAMQADLLKEKDAEIASLKAQLSQKEAKAVKAIRLRGQEQNSALEEEKSVLERKVVALEFANATKVAELASLTAQTAKLTQDLSELGLSCDELSVKASSLEAERDRLISQVSLLEGTCSELRDEVLDEEFYPRFLTTIAGWRWILCRGLRLVVVKCLQSPKYLAALGGAIGRAIDKGMQDGLTAGIDQGRWEEVFLMLLHTTFPRKLIMSSLQTSFVSRFPSFSHLESQKDASIADIMCLVHLEGLAAEFPEATQLQPSPEQLMLPIHRLEDQVVIGETSLSFSLDVVHSRAQRIRGGAASQRLSISDAMVPLIEPLFAKNLVGEASTSGVLVVVAATTALSTNFVEANFFLR
ncbi:hypothetical protein Tco_0154329 [Tanacetum coccineum]